jgi:2-polyprenyl-3-methyl-5-hydroxy-6-metoxy-1,4-benzoquinol methylase
MTNVAFEAYGNLAGRGTDPLLQAGRLPQHVTAERLVLADLLTKLRPSPTDSLLEIGCGPGSLAIPLSFLVRHVVAMDHAAVVDRGRERYASRNIEWLGGEFPKDAPSASFERILVYSVLHYLPSPEAVVSFCLEAASRLTSGGRMLLGDLPNSDRKARFLASEAGKAFDAAWRAGTLSTGEVVTGSQLEVPAGANMIGALDDALVLRIVAALRQAGFHAYVLPQPADLPFGHTREDILVERL